MAKPSDFYVSVLDFFAILLPGAIATGLLEPRVGRLVIGTLFAAPTSEVARWVVFSISTYFVGHLVFFAGAYVDPIFHMWRDHRRKHKPDILLSCAKALRDLELSSEEQTQVNTYQWARSALMAQFSAAAADIHRVEADSKFFRSLLILCAMVSAVFLVESRRTESFAFLVLAGICTLRYAERRLKCEKQAYMHIVVFHRLGMLSKNGAISHTSSPAVADDA